MDAAAVTFALLTLAFAAVARGLSRLSLTAPIAFVGAGAALSLVVSAPELDAVLPIRLVAEICLALVLFAEAAHVQPRQIRADGFVIARILVLGLAVSIGLGFLSVRLLLPDLTLLGALLLAAALAPTDAGLGAPVVTSPRVPPRIRRLLSVESGLNDGIVLPIVLFAVAGLAGGAGQPGPVEAVLAPLAGAGIGAAVGVGGGRLLGWSVARDLSTPRTRGLGVLGLAGLSFFLAHWVGANGYVSAFAAGTAFAAASVWNEKDRAALELVETIAEPLGFAVWLVFGLVAVPLVVTEAGWRELAVAVLSLVVIRTVAMWVALLGTGFRTPTVLFVGWFGPRGLVTVVFVLIALESLQVTEAGRGAVAAAVLTVLLSVVAHGLSAEPLAAHYGGWVDRARPGPETPSRPGAVGGSTTRNG
ncbi:cation:proton antiporter [Ornithinimicrobium sp. LYQ121]|uniref:cation:proton antiporter domain-containing protein n=1 Tax=Ornithinimicrobium sp. LYQ121 TaxID=3378801 RepID=UPI0038531EAD